VRQIRQKTAGWSQALPFVHKKLAAMLSDSAPLAPITRVMTHAAILMTTA